MVVQRAGDDPTGIIAPITGLATALTGSKSLATRWRNVAMDFLSDQDDPNGADDQRLEHVKPAQQEQDERKHNQEHSNNTLPTAQERR